jgi:hypothetical protein
MAVPHGVSFFDLGQFTGHKVMMEHAEMFLAGVASGALAVLLIAAASGGLWRGSRSKVGSGSQTLMAAMEKFLRQ